MRYYPALTSKEVQYKCTYKSVRLVSREEVNKAYRKLAVLLHPDKCVAPGSEDAFKAVVNARTSLLKNIK